MTLAMEVKLSAEQQYWQQLFEKIKETIPYDPKWANGTGYFDHAVKGEHAPKLKVGQIVKSQVPAPNSRQIVIVGTRFGNVVVFERYSPENDERSRVHCSNHPYILERAGIVKINRWDADAMLMYLDNECSMFNIGLRVEDFAKAVEDGEQYKNANLVH